MLFAQGTQFYFLKVHKGNWIPACSGMTDNMAISSKIWYYQSMEQNIANPTKKVSPKDVFLHLLMIVTLYASAASITTLLFQYINLNFPDLLEGGYYAIESARGAIRWAIAMLVVVFPTYLLTTRFLEKEYALNPEKRDLRIRKWLIYFTLFVTALIAIGDLVSLIYTFLGGEITVRFVLKVISVLLVVGSIFYYYFADIKKHPIQ